MPQKDEISDSIIFGKKFVHKPQKDENLPGSENVSIKIINNKPNSKSNTSRKTL